MLSLLSPATRDWKVMGTSTTGLAFVRAIISRAILNPMGLMVLAALARTFLEVQKNPLMGSVLVDTPIARSVAPWLMSLLWKAQSKPNPPPPQYREPIENSALFLSTGLATE